LKGVAGISGNRDLASCQGSHPPAGPPARIAVAFTTQPQSTLVHVALAKGHFLEEGLEIQPVRLTYGKASGQAPLTAMNEYLLA
jgi:ABC-type nitrate/sulfonate/bicarbonate transport system substrate-binding protein